MSRRKLCLKKEISRKHEAVKSQDENSSSSLSFTRTERGHDFIGSLNVPEN